MTENLNVFGKDARLPGGPNDENPTARHEGEDVPSQPNPEADKDLKVAADNSALTDAPDAGTQVETPAAPAE